jgi:hypothetical protein
MIEEKNDFYLVNYNKIALILENINYNIIRTVIDIKPQQEIALDR